MNRSRGERPAAARDEEPTSSTLPPRVGRVDITKVTRMRDVYLRFTSGQSGDFFNLYGFDFGH